MEFQSFLDYLSLEKKYSEKTIVAYKNDLQSFRSFNLKEFSQNSIKNVVYSQIRSWIVFLVDTGVTNKTINRKISSLNSYYKFLLKTNTITKNPLSSHKALKTKSTIQLPFSESEIDEVLNSVKEVYKNKEIIVIFQPHRISRVNDLRREFSSSFKNCDSLVLCPIYSAGEKIKLKFDYKKFANEIIKNSKVKLFMVRGEEDLYKFVNQSIYGNKVVIGMGAGSISNWMRNLKNKISN